MKMRIRFCWECGRQLRYPHFIEKVVDGHNRVLHKSCAEGKGYEPDWKILQEREEQRNEP